MLKSENYCKVGSKYKKGRKISQLHRFLNPFFSAASCKKGFKKWCSQKMVRSFLFCDGFSNKHHLLFQYCLLSLFVRLVYEICCFVKWNTGDEQVESALSLHISLSGLWIIFCLVWKVFIPLSKYMINEWDAEVEEKTLAKTAPAVHDQQIQDQEIIFIACLLGTKVCFSKE